MNVAAHTVARLCWQQGPHCKHQSIGAQERECVLHNEEGLQSALHPWRRQGYISATGWSGVPQHCVRAGMLAHLRGASVGHIPKAGCHSSCLGHSESPHHTSVSTRPCSLQQQRGKAGRPGVGTTPMTLPPGPTGPLRTSSPLPDHAASSHCLGHVHHGARLTLLRLMAEREDQCIQALFSQL